MSLPLAICILESMWSGYLTSIGIDTGAPAIDEQDVRHVIAALQYIADNKMTDQVQCIPANFWPYLTSAQG